jgi:hypothetical protein
MTSGARGLQSNLEIMKKKLILKTIIVFFNDKIYDWDQSLIFHEKWYHWDISHG